MVFTHSEICQTYQIATCVFKFSGNPGLGLSLSLEDFGSEAKPPEWLPRDRWENVMAISVLPGPLDNLCVKIAEGGDSWQKWYHSATPERQMVSENEAVDDNQTDSSRGEQFIIVMC